MLQLGETAMWSGLPLLAIMPLVPLLMKRFDNRVLIGVGLVIFGVSCMLNSHLDPNVAYDQLRFAQILRAIGQPLVMVPLSALATAGIEAADAGSASGLFNMMRNLGGSIGIALLAAVVTQREHLHSNRLGELISLYDPLTRDRIDALTNNFVSHGFDLTTAGRMALAALDRTVRDQTYLGAYGDAFFLIGIALFAATAVLFFTKSAPCVAGASAGAH